MSSSVLILCFDHRTARQTDLSSWSTPLVKYLRIDPLRMIEG